MQSREMLDVISAMRVEMYFSIFCLCPAAVLKKPHGLHGSPVQVLHGPWGEHAPGTWSSPWKEPQVPLSIHCMDSKVENIHGLLCHPSGVTVCRSICCSL